MTVPVHIGFTGTRKGLTLPQRKALKTTMSSIAGGYFHHGDCVGADEQACEVAREIGWSLICHPPFEDALRAHVPSAVVHLPLPYLTRNRMIVDVSSRLIVCPAGTLEERRSGTWSTARYGRRQNKPIIIVWPTGRVTFEPEG